MSESSGISGQVDLPSTARIIRDFGLRSRKSLGQNFLTDPSILNRIVREAGPLADRFVVEVGPGPGGLTRGILSENPYCLLAIERDERCIRVLQSTLLKKYPDHLLLQHADAMAVDLFEALRSSQAPHPGGVVIANLPFQIATALLIKWIGPAGRPWFSRAVLMFQKEVAERIAAAPDNKSYGRLSVLVQAIADVRTGFDVPASAFTPRPKVDGRVISIVPKCPGKELNFRRLKAVTQAAFGQRRKMLRRSLRPVFSEPEKVAEALGLDPQSRGETVCVADFIRLSAIEPRESPG